VVARGEGIPAVCGADAIRVDRPGKRFTVGRTTVAEGDWITIDGFTGKVFEGQLDLADSPIERARAGDAEARKDKIWRAYERFMTRADEARRLRVRANADTASQSANAIERGAEGIGLCRTEHMFLGEERVAAVRKMIFATTSEEEQQAYEVLEPLQRDDFVGIFREMDGKPVTVRLLDPPLHEFLPNQVDLAVAVAVAKEKGADEAQVEGEPMPLGEAEELLAKVNDLHEDNPAAHPPSRVVLGEPVGRRHVREHLGARLAVHRVGAVARPVVADTDRVGLLLVQQVRHWGLVRLVVGRQRPVEKPTGSEQPALAIGLGDERVRAAESGVAGRVL
jgi:pyruvate,orthophosphate dikinase